ncbi:MAG: helix-hairpin-helix domain-containing protein [Candidatus Aureabacteria bacterium]|nr:helix-hairpin-helix domain-containing protein [Candidatus Auribacterota bacterium]
MKKVNINHATVRQLESLPLIGHTRASWIIACRKERGPFGSVEELDLIPGIGPGIIARIKPFVTV